MNQRSIDAILTAGAGLFGAFLLVASALRLFAPIAPIVVTAPVLEATAAPRLAMRVASHVAPLVVARTRESVDRPRRELGVKTHARAHPAAVLAHPRVALKRPSRKLENAHVHSLVVAKVQRPRSERPSERVRPRSRALPEPPIGYNPLPMLAGVETEMLATSPAPDALPSLAPQRRRRR